jgi:serine-type D-Ala-D-Ala carboxypeptidase/endopeptidase
MTRVAPSVCVLVALTATESAQAPFVSDAAVQAMLEQVVAGRRTKGIVVDETGTRRVIAHGARPVDGDSVLEIGSMTKVFTGILVADMVRRGEVVLGDPLADLLPPEVRVLSRTKQITLLGPTPFCRDRLIAVGGSQRDLRTTAHPERHLA